MRTRHQWVCWFVLQLHFFFCDRFPNLQTCLIIFLSFVLLQLLFLKKRVTILVKLSYMYESLYFSVFFSLSLSPSSRPYLPSYPLSAFVLSVVLPSFIHTSLILAFTFLCLPSILNLPECVSIPEVSIYRVCILVRASVFVLPEFVRMLACECACTYIKDTKKMRFQKPMSSKIWETKMQVIPDLMFIQRPPPPSPISLRGIFSKIRSL